MLKVSVPLQTVCTTRKYYSIKLKVRTSSTVLWDSVDFKSKLINAVELHGFWRGLELQAEKMR